MTPAIHSALRALPLTLHLFLLAPLLVLGSNRDDFSLSPGPLVLRLIPLIVLSTLAVGGLHLIAARRRWVRLGAILTALTLLAYAQFYFFVWDYGVFDGQPIIWASKRVHGAGELAFILLVLGLTVRYPVKVSGLGTPLTFVLLGLQALVVLPAALPGPPASRAQVIPEGMRSYFHSVPHQYESINEYSRQRNILVLVLDTFQSDVFERIVESEPWLASAFSGFVYFDNAAGVFPYTNLSLPALLTGRRYQPGEAIEEYTQRVARDRIDRRLVDSGYVSSFLAFHALRHYVSSQHAAPYEMAVLYDTVLFRQAPHVLKPSVFNNHRFVLRSWFAKGLPSEYVEIDLAAFDRLTARASIRGSPPQFKYIHFRGPHQPNLVNAKCEPTSASFGRQAFEEHATCIIHLVARFLDRLKEIGAYDKSLIVLVADHGSVKVPISRPLEPPKSPGLARVMASAHPLLAIKHFGAKGAMRVSGAPVSLLDVAATILRRAGLDDAGDDTGIDSVGETSGRRRTFFFYRSAREANRRVLPYLLEYSIDGRVRHPGSWRLETLHLFGELRERVLTFVDFGKREWPPVADMGWTQGRGHAWMSAFSASVFGRLPARRSVLMRMRLKSPLPRAVLEVWLNGRFVEKIALAEGPAREYEVVLPLDPVDPAKVHRVEFRRRPSGARRRHGPPRLGVHFRWIRFE